MASVWHLLANRLGFPWEPLGIRLAKAIECRDVARNVSTQPLNLKPLNPKP